MWKDYSYNYLKHNKASAISVMIASLVATFFLTLISTLFYNMWKDSIDRIVLKEGNWQGRFTGDFSEEDIALLSKEPSIAQVNEGLNRKKQQVLSICLNNPRDIYQTLPALADKLSIEKNQISYHTVYLTQYMIYDPADKTPPLLLLFYLSVLIVAILSLSMIIKNAFATSMNARIYQLGIIKSVGATPRQIRTCLIQEALALSILPVIIGIALGVGGCSLLALLANQVTQKLNNSPASFYYHPLVLLITIVSVGLTILLSVWIPARKISKMTPLEAIHTCNEASLTRKHSLRILTRLFGIEGELAACSIQARKKELRTSALSLTLAFLAFSMFYCFATLSSISTKHTYFERYQNTWDVMVTISDTTIDQVSNLEEIRSLAQTQSCMGYQKALVYTRLGKEKQSSQLDAIGGLSALGANESCIKVPTVILDDASFLAYCQQQGIDTNVLGAVIVNKIWNSIDSNFRYKTYLPYVSEDMDQFSICNGNFDDESITVPIIGYTTTEPLLREEYENYGLLEIIPASLWETWNMDNSLEEPDTYLCILCKNKEAVKKLDSQIRTLYKNDSHVEIENRISEKETNDSIHQGYMIIISSLCIILAFIGIANVFTNAMGFIMMRKREFARYQSVGLTPGGICKILTIEVCLIAGKPVLITVPLTALFASFAINASYLNPAEFLEAFSIVPIIAFVFAIFFFVALAYYLGGKRVIGSNLIQTLCDETML